jgi:hypothetical protein
MTDSPTVPAETSLPLPSQAGPTTDRTTAPPTRQVPLASRPTLAGEASPAGRTTPTALEIRPVLGIGEITAGTDLAEVIATAAPWLADGDVLVVTSKIVSKAEGRLVALPAHGPARDAARDAALASAGINDFRFHDLRHTFASLLIAQGEHPKYIQVQMGHSSINVTMDTYGHLMNTVNQESAKRLDLTVFEKNGDFLETFSDGKKSKSVRSKCQ